LRWGLLHMPGAQVSIRSDSFPAFSTETKEKGPHRNGLPSAEVICSAGKKLSQKSSPAEKTRICFAFAANLKTAIPIKIMIIIS